MSTTTRMLRLSLKLLVVCGCFGCSGGGGSGDDQPPPGTPTAVIEAVPASGTVPLTVSFDGSASFTSDGTITTYSWDFGDGATATGPVHNHTYTSSGSFTVELLVTTDLNYSDEATMQIVVAGASGAPTAVIGANVRSGLTPLSVAFNSSGSSDPGGVITGYAWNFGDGGTSTAANPLHTFAAGVYTVTLTVTDNSAMTGTDSTVIAVANWDQEVVRLTNEQRWNYNSSHLPPLKDESHLNAAAQRHSLDMANNMITYISHTGTDGSTAGQRITEAGYTSWSMIAENIAAGQSTPAAVVSDWMSSSGHRANIMETRLCEIGVSYVYTNAGYRHFWTQDFGTRSNVYPVVINREAHVTNSAAVQLYIYGSTWAQEMLISNTPDRAGVWEPYASTKTWILASGLGVKTVYVTLKNGATERTTSDTIVVVEP